SPLLLQMAFYREPSGPALVIVSRQAARMRDILILDRIFQNRAGFHLADNGALDFLPRRLAFRIFIAARSFQGLAALGQFLIRDENIRRAATEIDAHAVAGLQNGQSAASGRFRRSVEDRRRTRCARLATVADARQRSNALLQEIIWRAHVDDFR